ncbi:MAG: acetate--CoA ligase family protein, partial [Deltaproteobacteria bacterium]|nr:acetate--CoA ligase family protein [Deltaproteobacteria bacterium]
NKPIAIYLSAGVDEIDSLMEQFNFPIFTRIVETFQALKLSYDHSQIIAGTRRKDDPTMFSVNNSRVNELLEQGLSDKRNLLLHEAMEVLEQYGVPTVRSAVATSGMEAKNVAENVGYPVAMKLISEDVLHKSDVGGVELNLRGGSTVEQAYDKMMARIHESYPKAKLDGVMIQPMVAGGRELIVGGRQDKQFGPVVLVGMGGIFVEIFEEATIRVAPISEREAKAMVDELKGAQILRGARGQERFDIDALVEVILRISQLLVEFPQISELDINPLRINPKNQGCLALDARIILN